jgi:hypothetical protein
VILKEEKDPIPGYVTMTLYPEGITVKSDMEGKKGGVKYVRVQAYEKENAGDLDRKWQVSEMQVTLAVCGEDRAIINPKEAEYRFDKLKGGGGKGSRADKEQSLAEKYEYEETDGLLDDGRYLCTIEPKAHLCEPEDGTFFIVLLTAHADYNAEEFEAEIPLRLCGKVFDPLEGWEQEYKKLQERIDKYSIPGEAEKWKKKVEEMALEPRSSTEQLRLTSKYLVRNYMRYWTIEGIKYRQDAELYDVIISQLEWIKFFGDCAFSYLVAAYAGPVAEAIISPAKDFAAESLGEVIAALNYGQKIDVEKFEFAKMIEGTGDNLVSNNISLTNWKTAAKTLAAYFVYSAIKNFFAKLRDKGEFDFYGSFCKAFSDMTVQGLKAGAGELFQKWVKSLQKNPKFQKYIGETVSKYMNKYAGKGRTFNLKDQKIKNVQYELNDSLHLEGELRKLAGWQGESKNVKITKIDFLQKIVTEFVGKEAGEVKEKVDKTDVKDYEFGVNKLGHVTLTLDLKEEDDPNAYTVTIDLTKAVMSASCGLVGLLFDGLFSRVPTSPAAIQAPQDPPLPPDTKES